MTLVRDVNTTISDSAVLECSIQDRAITDWRSLRFYWQDDRNVVLYSYNNGRKVAEHVNELYQHRVTDFPQDIVRGNITIVLKNLTLDDNGRTYSSFAAVLDDSGPRRYHLEHTQICEMTLHVGGEKGFCFPHKNRKGTLDRHTPGWLVTRDIISTDYI